LNYPKSAFNSTLLHFATNISSYPSPLADTSSISSALDFGTLIFEPSGGMQIEVRSSSRGGGGISFNSIKFCCCGDVVDDVDGMALDALENGEKK
jgi:hypothetical protein